MGLAYTIDSPVKVAQYGISSAISIVEDNLIEMMRGYYYNFINQKYKPILKEEFDSRARRITDYLNLMNRIVQDQVEKIKSSAFESGSEIVKYFEMLPEDHPIKKLYHQFMDSERNSDNKDAENFLRSQVIPGSIDVNIMTKVDREQILNGTIVENGSDAVAALRGYLESDLSNSSVVFSAGLNPRLYNFMESRKEFDADSAGNFTKKVVIKVSDFRSALIQGKYLAKKGIWVSEFRIESGLNCGGHAFASDGNLMGPILEEFKRKKEDLIREIFSIYNTALKEKGKTVFEEPHDLKITSQGGIGNAQENNYLLQHYGIEQTGWGTPFLLVPEATTVDSETLDQLEKANTETVKLSHNSPLGVRFHYLEGTSAHREKLDRIKGEKPGSPCTEKHLAFNTEFTKEPICTASAKYQKLKIEQLRSLGLPERVFQKEVERVTDKECLCVGLSNSAANLYNLEMVKKRNSVNICPGPNIAYFSKKVSLKSMIDHIYGRTNILQSNTRPHMFIKELELYLDYFEEQINEDLGKVLDRKKQKYYKEFYNNLLFGINYYRETPGISLENKTFYIALDQAEQKLNELTGILA